MSLAACAALVQRGDPDRFAAAMAAPVAAREVLFPIFALNIEVSRAPWLTAEPLIAEMRLQWWRDALDEIAAGGPVRRHEVTEPLARVLDAEGAAVLDRLVAARRADIERAPFADTAALEGYLDATGGNLAWATTRALGGGGEAAVRDVAHAGALANYLLGVPELKARGRVALPEDADVVALASGGLERLRHGRRQMERAALPAVLWAWQAEGVLRRARRRPEDVDEGRLRPSEFARRAGLLQAAVTSRV